MEILSGDEAAERLDGLVHEKTQVSTHGVDLTVAEIHELDGSGSLDFGGSEEEAAPGAELDPVKMAPDDDYGWWNLPQGAYRVVYNETPRLGDGELGRVECLPRTFAAGATHAAWTADSESPGLSSLLVVGPAGCRLKENCRISRWTVFVVGE